MDGVTANKKLIGKLASCRLAIRQVGAVGVAFVAVEALASFGPDLFFRSRVIARLARGAGPSFLELSLVPLLIVLLALVLVTIVPRLWRGNRTAVWVATAALSGLAALNLARGRGYAHVPVEAGLALLLLGGRKAFVVGSRNRPRPLLLGAGFGAWALVYGAMIAGRVIPHHRFALRRTVRHAVDVVLRSGAQMRPPWILIVEALIASAIALSLLAVSSLFRPRRGGQAHSEEDYRRARAIIERWGEDSLSPFVLRPDKAFHFAADGVLAYRLVGETAVVSGDPVAPPGAVPEVLASFLGLARERGWWVAIWGASARHLQSYRALGLHAVRAGEEAFVDPARFSLEGRHVRKLRQSANRIQRRGWRVVVCDGREVDADLECEIDAVETRWRAGKRRVLGFAMGMGTFTPEVRPDDLYVLARSPEGELRAVMRFLCHSGCLSLEAMRRVGETPNGLNEALVAAALEAAAERGVPEVSLNYAGLAHLVRGERAGATARTVTRVALPMLGRRFQLERLVRFNDKFLPEWRPRFLVYESPGSLPRAIARVLQAEGYLPAPQPLTGLARRALPRAAPGFLRAHVSR